MCNFMVFLWICARSAGIWYCGVFPPMHRNSADVPYFYSALQDVALWYGHQSAAHMVEENGLHGDAFLSAAVVHLLHSF